MIRNLRWYIVGLLTLVTAINYLDRQTLSVAQTVLEDEFGMTNEDYGNIVSMFLIAYGIMHPLAGRFIDWINTRRGLALSLVWWSLANMGHAFASSVGSFAGMRFLLGVGEAGNFPAAVKTVGEWFPAKERALATGIFNVGAGLGAVIAPPLVGFIIIHWGWKAAFITTGLIGFLWLIPWLALARSPEGHPRITPEELEYIKSGQEEKSEPEKPNKGVWKEALKRRELWALMAARFLSDPAWLFFAFWIPKYFKDMHGFDIKSIALFIWMPFLAADIGSIVGGWVSSHFVKRGMSVVNARKTAMAIFAALMPITIFAVRTDSWQVAIFCISVAAFAHQSWAASVLTFPVDLFPKRMVASCYGLTGMMGVLGGALSQHYIGSIVDKIGYFPVFTVVGFLHPAAACTVWALIRQRKSKPDISV